MTDNTANSAWEAYQLDVAEASRSGGEEDENEAEADPSVESGGDVDVPTLPEMATGGKNKSTSFQERWETNVQRLEEFKEEHGHVNVNRGHDKQLGRWVMNQRQSYRNLLEGNKSSLTVDRIQDLERLGFQWTRSPETYTEALGLKTVDVADRLKVLQGVAKAASVKIAEKGRAKDDENWNTRLEQLRNFKERSGHFMVPCSDTQGTKRPRDDDGREEEITIHPDTVRLGKWVKRQRRLYITKKLQPERLEALKEIEFDLKPGAATKEERLEVQLGLLDALRKRRELSKAQVQDLDQLAEEWKRRATEPRVAKPVYGQRGQGGGNKFDLKWAHHFEQLKQFQIKNGHTRVPQFHLPTAAVSAIDPSVKSLGKWVDYNRQSYWKRQKGGKVALTDDRIVQLESIGFEWRIRQAAQEWEHSDFATLKNDAEESFEDMDLSSVFTEQPEAIDGEHVNDHKWNCRMEELTRYKQLLGTATVKNPKHPVHGEQLANLVKWSGRQRELLKKCGLSKSRIRRLKAIDFQFEATPGKPVNFRGWDAKLNILKAFKSKYGHCRVPSRRKKGHNDPLHDPEMSSLAKWVEHQRSLYWKRAKGEKNPMSDERIDALNDIGFEWRIVHSATRLSASTGFSGLPIQHGMKSEEESRPNNNDVAEAAELSAAHQVIDAIPDSIPNLAPATVDVENASVQFDV